MESKQLKEQFGKNLIINENLSKYFKKNLLDDEIIIGMGAGSISKWVRELKYSL